MSEITDSVSSPDAGASFNKINSLVAIFVAVTATFMALCNVKDGNLVQAMSQAQARSIDAWSYFQAKSTKEAIVESCLENLKQSAPHNDTLLKNYQEQIVRYEKEKGEIKAQAEGFQKQYDDINLFDDQFDMTEALLTISIALFGITSLTQKKWLLYFSASLSTIGIILGLTSFMNISLYSDLISRILG